MGQGPENTTKEFVLLSVKAKPAQAGTIELLQKNEHQGATLPPSSASASELQGGRSTE